MAELGPGATIGFAGLGNMGTPMAARLIAAGYTVIGFDPEAAAGQRLAGHGGRVAAEVAELGKADAVILMLPNSAVVRAVLIEDGLRDALAEGAIVIDMSSSEPLQTRELVADLATHGVRMVDAPVSGGVKGAQNGTLTIMVGGPDADVAEVNPVLTALGKPKHVGPGRGRPRAQGAQQPDVGDAPVDHLGGDAGRQGVRARPDRDARRRQRLERPQRLDGEQVAELHRATQFRLRFRAAVDAQGHEDRDRAGP